VDKRIIEKLKLEYNGCVPYEEHMPLKEVLRDIDHIYTQGGSDLNTMKQISKIFDDLNIRNKLIFTGCLGEDEFSKQLEKLLHNELEV